MLSILHVAARGSRVEYYAADRESSLKEVPVTHLEDNVVLLADLDNLRMPHERMQVDLVDGGQRRPRIEQLLDMLLAPVRHLGQRQRQRQRRLR